MHEWLNGKERAPIKIDAELHRRCNLSCRFCSRRENNKDMTEESKEIEIPKERWLEIAEQSGEMGVRAWNISGIGEPMCKPDLTLSVMEKLKEYDVFGEMTTNGTLWTEEMVKKTVEMEWDSICVSLDSPDRDTHNWLRQSDAYDKALKTLSLFSKWKGRLDGDKPTLTINVVLNKENYKQMPELFLLAKDLDVDSVFVEPMIVYTEQGEELKLDKDEIREFEEIAERCESISKKYGIEPNINCFDENRDYEKDLVDKTSEMKDVIEEDRNEGVKEFKDPDREYSSITDKILNLPCYYPWFYMIITADGSASHCGEKINKKENIRDKNLEEIWYSDSFEDERERFLDGNLPKYCDRCRPNVVGDARRIRKSIIELRDKNYLIDAVSEAGVINETLRDKIEILNEYDGGIAGCEDNCIHKKELEELKDNLSYKVTSKISGTDIGNKLKRSLHKALNSPLEENERMKDMEPSELRQELWKRIKENKKLKDRIYKIRENRGIYETMKEACEYKKEVKEIKNSMASKLM